MCQQTRKQWSQCKTRGEYYARHHGSGLAAKVSRPRGAGADCQTGTDTDNEAPDHEPGRVVPEKKNQGSERGYERSGQDDYSSADAIRQCSTGQQAG